MFRSTEPLAHKPNSISKLNILAGTGCPAVSRSTSARSSDMVCSFSTTADLLLSSVVRQTNTAERLKSDMTFALLLSRDTPHVYTAKTIAATAVAQLSFSPQLLHLTAGSRSRHCNRRIRRHGHKLRHGRSDCRRDRRHHQPADRSDLSEDLGRTRAVLSRLARARRLYDSGVRIWLRH